MGFIRLIILVSLAGMILLLQDSSRAAFAAQYYQEQTNFTENSIPSSPILYGHSTIAVCIAKDQSVSDSYYVWTKLAVQEWRQALREYTGNPSSWNIYAHYVPGQSPSGSCDIKVFILKSYKDFPGYPNETGAYTIIKRSPSSVDVQVYLSPTVLHANGVSEISLPSYAFRNSALHEFGHTLGLGHMKSLTGYLMSPAFDYWVQKQEMPITTLELDAIVNGYGEGGFR